jgi:hypothetical protein
MSQMRAVMERVGDLSQLGGTKLIELQDGQERGTRVIEFRTTTGLDFGVNVDRAFDIGYCRYRGRSLVWHSPTGFAAPGLRENAGMGPLRTFGGGLMVTCGLDHILFPQDDPNDTYNYPGSTGASYPLHGRISNTPATLREHGVVEIDGSLVLRARGEVRQAGALAENLVLEREVTVGLDGRTIRWVDTVRNEGWYPAPHMFLYHINLGAPLISESCEILAPIEEVLFATPTVPSGQKNAHLDFAPPAKDFVEQAFLHRMKKQADGMVEVAIINRDDRAAPWGVIYEYDGARFKHFFQWRYLDRGRYVIGIEPSTNDISGRLKAREMGELTMLAPGQSLVYRNAVTILDGREAVDAARARLGAGK